MVVTDTSCLLGVSALVLLLASCSMTNDVQAQDDEQQTAVAAAPEQARELGSVRWGRAHDQVFAAARADGRPVLLLFQEIPG